MNWRLWSRGDIAAIIIAVAILAAFLVLFIAFPNAGWRAHLGFGPNWDCTYPGKGDPVCIRRAPAPGNESH
jgi:hypothetical protein